MSSQYIRGLPTDLFKNKEDFSLREIGKKLRVNIYMTRIQETREKRGEKDLILEKGSKNFVFLSH